MTRGSAVTEGLNSDGGLTAHALSRVSMEQIMRLFRLHGELWGHQGFTNDSYLIIRAFQQLFNVLRLSKGFSAL